MCYVQVVGPRGGRMSAIWKWEQSLGNGGALADHRVSCVGTSVGTSLGTGSAACKGSASGWERGAVRQPQAGDVRIMRSWLVGDLGGAQADQGVWNHRHILVLDRLLGLDRRLGLDRLVLQII